MATGLMRSFLEDLKNDRFTLSSLPEVAMNIRKALDDPEISADSLATIINQDPAIATKILRTSNSVLYRGRNACETVSASVARMGFKTTRQLVTSFAVKELFDCDAPALRKAMQEAWEHSLTVGAIAHALAQHTKLFSAEEAMLAGILSNIGVLSAFNYVANHPEVYEDPARLDAAIKELKTEVGALVLDRWAFPPEYLACALEAENWGRDTGKAADLCDLIIVAGFHAGIGKRDLPAVDEVPAFAKIVDGELTPETAIEFMNSAREQIDEARTLLAA